MSSASSITPTTSSSSTPEQWAAMSKLVQQFYAKPDAEPFREPVDWKGLGLSDYPHIINKPMDLGTIKKNISSNNKYRTIYECGDDVRLVWENCMKYNQDGSDFYVLAQSLSRKWEEKYGKLLQDLQLGPHLPKQAEPNTASLNEKRTFAKNLYKLSKEEMGKLLVQIDETCPRALIKNAAEDECDLNVDKISNEVFARCVEYVDSCLAAKAKAGKKKSVKKSRTSV